LFPQSLVQFFTLNQEALWVTTLLLDLTGTLVLYRLFGKVGLQVAIATAIILANLQGPKLTSIFGFETTIGVIFYSSIFLATDILSENYGRAEANKAVRMGFVVSLIVLLMLSLSMMYIPTERQFSIDVHNAFKTILNFTPRFVLGSLFAYIISQSFDVWAYHRIKRITGEKWLWLRNNLSTMCSQVIDTTLFSLVVWWGTVDLNTALKLGAAKFGFKIIIAVIDTGFLYWARGTFRRHNAPVLQTD
jgi:queuosine precursor transporter